MDSGGRGGGACKEGGWQGDTGQGEGEEMPVDSRREEGEVGEILGVGGSLEGEEEGEAYISS